MGAKGVVLALFFSVSLTFPVSLSSPITLPHRCGLVEWNSCPDTISIAERSGKYSFAMRLQTNTQRRRVSARFANHLGENVFAKMTKKSLIAFIAVVAEVVVVRLYRLDGYWLNAAQVFIVRANNFFFLSSVQSCCCVFVCDLLTPFVRATRISTHTKPHRNINT